MAKAELSGIGPTHKRVVTSLAMVHEAGHPEPWIIALSGAPTNHRAFDHGLRRGIEAMSPDFESRGFGVADGHLRHTDRLDRLLLVMAPALYWAVSTGMWDASHRATPDEKNVPSTGPAPFNAAWLASSPAACAASSDAPKASSHYRFYGAPG